MWRALSDPRNSRKILRAAVTGVAILLLGLLLTEIAFRLLHRVSPVFIFPAASYNRMRAEPHSTTAFGFTHNSYGFKDVEHPLEKPAGVFRILGVGDSFVYGALPYQHNFLTLLEDDLAGGRGRSAGPSVEVIKMGIPAAELGDYFSLLVNEGLQFDPDLVIVCFYIGNDFQLSQREGTSSYLLAFLRYLFRIMPAYEGPIYRLREYDDARPTLRPEEYRSILRRKIDHFAVAEPRFRDHFPDVAGYLEKIRRLCAESGAELLVVLIPDELQVDPEVRGQQLATMPEHRVEDFDFDLPNRELGAELERQGIRYLDLLAPLRAAQEEAPTYRRRDTHWNIRGNRVAAREIARTLAADGWLASDSGRQEGS